MPSTRPIRPGGRRRPCPLISLASPGQRATIAPLPACMRLPGAHFAVIPRQTGDSDKMNPALSPGTKYPRRRHTRAACAFFTRKRRDRRLARSAQFENRPNPRHRPIPSGRQAPPSASICPRKPQSGAPIILDVPLTPPLNPLISQAWSPCPRVDTHPALQPQPIRVTLAP